MTSEGTHRGKTRLGGPSMDVDGQKGKAQEKKPVNMCVICKIRPAKRRYCKGCSFIVSDARARRDNSLLPPSFPEE